jgi:hypothetical protein
MRSSSLLAAALLFVAAPALAQSSTDATPAQAQEPTLSDLAKKAQENKDKKAAQEKDQKNQKDQKDQKKKGPTPAIKTFTNDDLKPVSSSPSDDSTAADKSGAKDSDKPADAKSGDAAKGDAAKKDEAANTDQMKTEKYWRDRMEAAREDVRRNQAFAAALQSRINGLTADFTARDDPYQRAQIADDRQKALAELDRVNKAIEDGNKTIAAIQEDARRAMVPAGWIR